MRIEDIEELKMQLEILAGVVADLDEENRHAIGVAGDFVRKISNIAGLPKVMLDAASAALDSILKIETGELSFGECYPLLCERVDVLSKKADLLSESEAAPVSLSPEDIQEIEAQLDILEGLLEVMSPDNKHVIGVAADLFRKIENLAAAGEEIVKEARAAATEAEALAAGAPFEAGHQALCAAAKRIRLIVTQNDTVETEPGDAVDFFSEDREELVANFQERQAVLLDELEAEILNLENGTEAARGNIIQIVNNLKDDASGLKLDRASEFLENIADIMSRGCADNDRDAVGALLAAKDLLSEYFNGLSSNCDGQPDKDIINKIIKEFGKVAAAKSVSNEAAKPAAKACVPVFTLDISNPELFEFVTESREYLNLAEVALIALEKEPDNKEHINEIFRGFHNIKGISGFLGLKDVQEVSHNAESLLDKARKGEVELTGSCAHASFAALDMLKEMVERVHRAIEGERYETPSGYVEIISRLKDPKSATDVKKSVPKQAESKPAAECRKESAPEAQAGAAGKAKTDGMIKVSTNRLDSLIDAVGELVIANAMVTQEPEVANTVNARLSRNVALLGKITRELQELAMSMRMVSLKSTFQKMARLARDLGIKCGTPLEFTYAGEDTELDRNVVEEISSPLVHMIRNAVDHGLESPEERRKRGKPEKGSVSLSACHEGGNVVIRIQDDGRGLDREAILRKAEAQGIIKSDAGLSDKEIFSLIFHAGLSTAKKVTDVSGRGVGMDVVRRSIENLRGRIEIESELGQGSTFTIRLPLTLAIIDGMLVAVAEERYIVPTIAIHESLRPAKNQVSTVLGKGEMLTLRGNQLPLFRLGHIFGVDSAKTNPCDALTLIIGENGSRYALMVDDLLGQYQVVIKSLGKSFDRLDGVSGGAILGDGRVALILDAAGLTRATGKFN
jgi:two-component system, chemotaxis family, sensor kinase CheA